MNDCLKAEKFEKFHYLSFLSLTIFGTGASICLTAAITIAIAEPLQFLCLTTAGNKAVDRIQKQGYEDYGMKAGQFPMYAFVLLDFLPILLVCFVFQGFLDITNEKMRCGGKVSTAYISILVFRILVLAVFVPLQWGHFYPVLFPTEHIFTPPQTGQVSRPGYNYTKAANATLAPLVYDCKNSVAVAKSTLSIVLFLLRCFVLVLSLMEMIQLAYETRKFNQDGSFLDDDVFCQKFLEKKGAQDQGLSVQYRANSQDAESQGHSMEDRASHQDASTRQPTTSPVDTVKEAADVLKKRYKKREASIHPFPWYEDWQLSLDKIYTKLQMVSKEREREYKQTEDYFEMHEIFKAHPEESARKPRVVLVEGKPGIGKTTFSQKLTYDWSMDKIEISESFPEFKIFLKLKCRDLASEAGSTAVDILKKAIADLFPNDRPKLIDALIGYINDAKCNVLMLLDGFDELPQDIDLYPLIKGDIFSNLHLLLTSRDNPELRQHCDSLFKIIGFTLEDAKNYIREFFRPSSNGQVLLERIEAESQDGVLRELTRSPLNTTLLCAVFKETEGQLPLNTTQLYKQIISCILKIYHKKKDLPVEKDEDLMATHKKDLAALGRLALKGLQKDQLHFSEDDLPKKDRARRILDYGFLSKATSDSIFNPRSTYQFLHKTLQEFFAALYLQKQFLSGNKAYLKYFSKTTGDGFYGDFKFKQVAIFLAGLMSQNSEAGKICVRLVRSLTQNFSNTDRRSSFLYICDVIRENVSVDLEEDLHSAVVSSFTWERLVLNGERLDENSVEYRLVCQVLERNGPLERLYLSYNEIKDISMLGNCIVGNSTLEFLLLYNNPLLPTGVRVLAKNLQNNKTLEGLGLDKKWENHSAILELKRHNTHLNIHYSSL